MFVAAMFGGGSLLSPLVGYLGKRISMRALIIYPNLLVAMMLCASGFLEGATLFALVIGGAFVLQVFPRVGEMNMFRVLYPPTHRGAAVGWVKAVAGISGLLATVLGTLWFLWQPQAHYWAYVIVGVALALSAASYARIPTKRKNEFADTTAGAPHRAFLVGLRVFLSDRRFVLYQLGFWFAGFANHMSFAYVAESLKEDIGASDVSVFWIVAVIPALFLSASAPLWGRFLDRTNPMSGRALFNLIQCVAYSLYCYGGLSLQLWPFVVAAVIHAVGNGGSSINWLTGSLYFAPKQHVSLYNSIHVALTGLRGLLAPILGVWLYGTHLNLGATTVPGWGLGPAVFGLSALFSLFGVLFMTWLARSDTGPAEDGHRLKRSDSEPALSSENQTPTT